MLSGKIFMCSAKLFISWQLI